MTFYVTIQVWAGSDSLHPLPRTKAHTNPTMVVVARSVLWLLPLVAAQNLDQFTYEDEKPDADNDIWPPRQWGNVRCANQDECVSRGNSCRLSSLPSLTLCRQLGWPDTFDAKNGWELDDNYCLWCPATGNSCPTHHQSPINLQRNRAIAGDPDENECIDVHWMAYYDSTCSVEELRRLNAFTIERHALHIAQPIENTGGDTWRLACRTAAGRRFGRIDFSRGFSQVIISHFFNLLLVCPSSPHTIVCSGTMAHGLLHLRVAFSPTSLFLTVHFSHRWHLSHLDIHVPSEHTQEGKRYSGELQLYHFYSVPGEEAGVDNEMGAVSIFLEAYEDTPDYDFLNRAICEWRRAEERTRSQCGLPSIPTEYPGCYPYKRGFGQNVTSPANAEPDAGRKLRGSNSDPTHKIRTAQSLILHNTLHGNATNQHKIMMSEEDYDSPDIDWDAFIAEVYAHEEARQHGRHLVDYEHVGPWHNYFGMLGVKTEYYYRYSGSQTIPPCYGPFRSGTRSGTNHWRVMKDPIRVSQRQINELHRLLKDRIAPADDPLRACQPDTAAKSHPDEADKVWVARPLMETHTAHFKVFCECQDWRSKWEEDKAWCEMDQMSRLYDQPYNFKSTGF